MPGFVRSLNLIWNRLRSVLRVLLPVAETETVAPPLNWTRDTHCYLCGDALGDDSNRDHVPPRRIFPSAIRRELKVDLLTLRTHPRCHAVYQRDEEYFFNALLPNALPSRVGPLLAQDFRDLVRRDSVANRLSRTIERELEGRPGELILPRDLLVQRVQPGRVDNIAWKIVRGLYTHHTNLFLPEQQPRAIEIYGPFDREHPDYVRALASRILHGHTPSCFAYTFADFREIENWTGVSLHVWLLNLWESYFIFSGFHDPSCICDRYRTP